MNWKNPKDHAPVFGRLYLVCMRDTDGMPDLYITDRYMYQSDDYNDLGWEDAAYEVVAYMGIPEYRGEA